MRSYIKILFIAFVAGLLLVSCSSPEVNTEDIPLKTRMDTISYIHLNPVKSGLCTKPEEWLFSDYTEWIGTKKSARNIAFERESIFGSIDNYIELINMKIQDLLSFQTDQ